MKQERYMLRANSWAATSYSALSSQCTVTDSDLCLYVCVYSYSALSSLCTVADSDLCLFVCVLSANVDPGPSEAGRRGQYTSVQHYSYLSAVVSLSP